MSETEQLAMRVEHLETLLTEVCKVFKDHRIRMPSTLDRWYKVRAARDTGLPLP